MSNARIFCIGALLGFFFVSIGSMFLGPPAGGLLANLAFMALGGCGCVAIGGDRAPTKRPER